MTTVYFATNRQITNNQDAVGGYPATMVPPNDPTQITYGTAGVTGVNITSNDAGAVSGITDISRGGFSPQAIGTLSNPDRDLLVFIHGYDNTFSDALTRAALNGAWLAASGAPRTDTVVVTFSWPSIGGEVSKESYQTDQRMAQASGAALTCFLANLDPVLKVVRDQGFHATLLAHSMGNLALESAVETWFQNGDGDDVMFDLAILAAADCPQDTFGRPGLAGLAGLPRLAKRVSIYYSQFDEVLELSNTINGVQRLGQDGPRDRMDTGKFPLAQFTMNNCGAYRDFSVSFQTSHQYYRMSPSVRSIIATDMAGSPTV